MIQQVNLYQPGGKDKHPLANAYMLTLIAAVSIMMLLSGLEMSTLKTSRSQINQLQNQMQQAQTHLHQLQAEYPNQQIDSVLSQELRQTQSYYQNLSQLLELLADNRSDRSKGFSRYLSALAEQADSNVWLTGIRINSEKDSISLKGSTYKPDQIPLLLQRLQNASVFKGRHFAKLSIAQSPQNPEQIDFSVSSSLKAETEEADEAKP